MEANASTKLGERVQTAVDRCQGQIDWYCKHKRINRWWFFITQSMAVAFGALTPVIIAVDGWKWLQALLPALGAIAAGLGASFGFRESWVRFAMTEELLKSELAKFRTRTQPYAVSIDADAVLENFVGRTESIVLSEATQWITDLRTEMPHTERKAATVDTRKN